MKKITLVTFALICMSNLFGQLEGKISYTETIKMDIQIEGLDDSMLDMIPKSQDLKKQLYFNSAESLYKNKKGESLDDTEMESDDGNIKIVIMTDDTEDILYINHKEKHQVHQRGLFGKSFVVEYPIQRSKWKLTNEKIKYLDYECQKATLENDSLFVVAWFTTQIPAQIGPAGYFGLPGAILMISQNDGELEIKASKVELMALDEEAIEIPDEGKKVTEIEFDIIRKEKEAEMVERFSRGRSSHR